jgi:uncharacterized protein YukE
MANNTTLSDSDLLNVLNQLEQQSQNMLQAANEVESIRQEVNAHFQAAASTVFQGKIDEWEARYNRVRQAYDTLFDNLNTATKGMGSAHENAVEVAGSFGVSDDILKGLS